MTTFDERERGYEAKFAHDADLRFKATARRNKALAAWAAVKLGLLDMEAADYVRSVVREEIAHPGEEHLIARLVKDFAAKRIPVSETDIRAKTVELTAMAVTEIEAER